MTGTVKAGGRNTKSFRIWDGSYADLKLAAGDIGMPPTTLVGDAMEALLGYIRCAQCSMPVPVEFGDVTGVDTLDAIAAAVRQVAAQRCWAYEGVERVKRPMHAPVLIGSRAAREQQGRTGEGEQAATRERVPRPRTEPRAPVPPQARRAPRQPEETSPVAAESSSAAAARQIADGIPGVTTASELTGPAAVFRSFDPADEPFTPAAVPVPAVPERAKRGLARPECTHIVSAGTRCKICEPAR
jgi:hypothetical protein